MGTLQLSNKLPALLREQDFWVDLMDSLDDELTLLKDTMDQKKSFLSPRDIVNSADLIDLARSFGYDPNLILNSDLEYLQSDVESIFFKIISKSTLGFYKYIFKIIPRVGRVYIGFYNDAKLLRGYDKTALISNLNNHDFAKIFKDFTPELFFSNLQLDGVTLDSDPLIELDSDEPWYLDEEAIVKPTQHISLEYVLDMLIEKGGLEYLLTSEYFWYIEKFINYGKRVTSIPSVGAQLNLVVNESLWFDDYDYLNTGYSWPEIKTRCAVTSFYKNRVLLEPMAFDSNPDNPFDQAITFEFDTTTTNEDPKAIADLFTRAAVGDSQKYIASKKYPDIWRDLMLFASFDETEGTDVDDLSTNDYLITVTGSYERVQGISGKTIQYSGIDTTTVITALNIDVAEDITIMFWFKEVQGFTDKRILFSHQGSYEVYLETVGLVTTLYLKVEGSISTVVGSVSSKAFIGGTDNMVTLTKNSATSEVNLKVFAHNFFIPSVETTIDITGIGDIGSSNDCYLGSNNTSDYFEGLIDELRIYQKVLPDDELEYFANTKLGSLKNMSNEVYSITDFHVDEMLETEGWKTLNISFPANARNTESMGVGDGIEDTFTYTLDYDDLEPHYLYIEYDGLTSEQTNVVTDNGKGLLVHDRASGTVNYKTGEVVLNAYNNIQVNREVLSLVPITNLIVTTVEDVLQPSTLKLRYILNSVNYLVEDDGLGSFTGSGGSIVSSTIVYATGEVTITFSEDADDITLDYIHRTTDVPEDGSILSLDYRTKAPLLLTEFGLFDDNDNQVLYATFPPIEFNSPRDHISFNIAVKDV